MLRALSCLKRHPMRRSCMAMTKQNALNQSTASRIQIMHDNDSSCSKTVCLPLPACMHTKRCFFFQTKIHAARRVESSFHQASRTRHMIVRCVLSQHEMHVALCGGNRLTYQYPISPSGGILVSIPSRALPEYTCVFFFSLSLRGRKSNQWKQQPRDSSDIFAQQSPTILQADGCAGHAFTKLFFVVQNSIRTVFFFWVQSRPFVSP